MCLYYLIKHALMNDCYPTTHTHTYIYLHIPTYIYIYIGWNNKIVVLKKTTLQLYFKTFIEKINSANFIM